MAANTQEEPVLAMEELPFMKLRLALDDAKPGDLVAHKQRSDRTMAVLRKWAVLQDTLSKIRGAWVGCCEPTEGKNGQVSLRVVDREKWENLQDSLKSVASDFAAVEVAIRELNSIGPAEYLGALYDARFTLGRTEATLRNTLSAEAQNAISRGRLKGLSVEAALKNDEPYLRKKALCEQQVETAKKSLVGVNEKIARIEKILEDAGC